MNAANPSETPPPIRVVTVSYRSRDCIEAALTPLRAACEAGWAECVVVDNASEDGSADSIAERFPWVRLIRSAENQGFGRACNLGARGARSPYLLFLNADASIEADDLRRLLDFAESHSRVAVVAPAIREPGGALQHANRFPTPFSVAAGRVRGAPLSEAIEPGSPPRRVDWVCGAVMLVRRSAFEALGGFDPRFFLYFEETDLCRRAAHAGGETWALGAAVARHANAQSARALGGRMVQGCLAEHYYPSRYYYLAKHHGVVRAVLAELGELAVLTLRSLLQPLRGRALAEGIAARLRSPILRLPAQRGDAP